MAIRNNNSLWLSRTMPWYSVLHFHFVSSVGWAKPAHKFLHLEESLLFGYNCIIHLPLSFSDVCQIKNSFDLFPETIEEVADFFGASSPARSDATQNCSKRRFHRGQSSGFLKLNDPCGCKRSWRRLQCPRYHHVILSQIIEPTMQKYTWIYS